MLRNIKEEDGVITFDVEQSQVFSDVEDFEGIDVTEADTTVTGKTCGWQLIKTRIVEPGEGNCNGTKAVAMTGSTALRSTVFGHDVKLIELTAFNPTTRNGKLQAYYSTDGKKWKEIKAVGNENGTVARTSVTQLRYQVSWEEGMQFQFIERNLKEDQYLYVDDVTFLTDEVDTSIEPVSTVPTGSKPEYYDLSGRKVDGVGPGLYIVRQGGKSRKVVIPRRR